MPHVACLLLLPMFSHVRVGRTLRHNISDIGGQQGSNGLQKLLGHDQGFGGLGVTNMARATIISNASQVRQRTEDSADV
jgi:hypothetical protein